MCLLPLSTAFPAVSFPWTANRSESHRSIGGDAAFLSELGLVVTMPTMLWLADSLGAPWAAAVSAILFGAIITPLFLLGRSAEHDPVTIVEPAVALAAA